MRFDVTFIILTIVKVVKVNYLVTVIKLTYSTTDHQNSASCAIKMEESSISVPSLKVTTMSEIKSNFSFAAK